MTNKIQHIHILGICGTFMGGIAALAKELGFRVTGCDAQVYPPMSTQLEELGIELMQGYKTEHFDDEPDLVIVGNAMSRGNVMVEYILDRNIPYISGPQWLLENVLKNCWVLAVSGTHGKTTTSSMLTWILEYAQLSPGFLIGGVPQNFNCSARLGNTPFFVIEADEYDTAFFDKRSKFVHYRPRTLVINNLEFDHGDIFNNLSDIQRQFHHLIRMVPSNGLILSPKNEFAINETLAMGCWTPTEQSDSDKGWQANKVVADGSEFIVTFNGKEQGTVKWGLIGDFNIDNALMAIAAARHAGVPSHIAIEALAEFINTKRRLELRGTVNQIKVYDDFAHHPTAIAKTLAGVRAQVDGNNSPGRVIAVLEPRSNTMKSGVHKDTLPGSLAQADQVFLFQGEQVKWSVSDLINNCQQPCIVEDDINQLVNKITDYAQAGDSIVVMSNGSFSSIHEKLLQRLDLK
ncbi:UDP-N-acetylmuramate:L-alanyl-gamma-D-glutamyl-meso-diaminopimelate ligase [Colwellia sp. 1_MG-2023]|uniref:UDP-N-acetylmuramate:L-alanyl-gamma-D-glutamyl- meso-diaminopimelate ligase n=1 Tax=unclassified Colwellia TaxID=196834 RepID=UPI001C0A4358|nr:MULTISPECIES: UDP-N-acetylmuramate:L-alanyl-gamma-D-glutamyl-meso-diaminopimelate ligase [unclassified Colwellia]MBU2925103.1 UDP-N-acetylmuramate:L-alanyl-gamma-D-glutamyl-meso-diaminopimelate ligase [Colwellia sp. C2M11]MDO6651604.1 UDP-N-acetylmuramate:L-alanyl-gamma-D-glutamyl-meso-diaminopimelate ligase [Colwellia sp. 3_MG-2023]MDO6664998.1 UDP-N-acetylmuramate:L-alanyl-gamma-D-glutamyl-meso-diaminopimelate ligase [Colwellia sp. 2_MG-2023]MDO6689371.1 UDP-N-acetylmuramate:L-alanyl-gamma